MTTTAKKFGPKADVGLSPTQQKLWDTLDGGDLHENAKLRLVIDPGGGCDLANLRCHMSLLRTKVRTMGNEETVIAENGGYRRVKYVKHL